MFLQRTMIMMYKHQIDKCIEDALEELKVARKYRNRDYIDHLTRRIQSYHKLREKAPRARIGAKE